MHSQAVGWLYLHPSHRFLFSRRTSGSFTPAIPSCQEQGKWFPGNHVPPYWVTLIPKLAQLTQSVRKPLCTPPTLPRWAPASRIYRYDTTEQTCEDFKTDSLLLPPDKGYRRLLRAERGDGEGLGSATRQCNFCLSLLLMKGGDHGKVWRMHAPARPRATDSLLPRCPPHSSQPPAEILNSPAWVVT